MKIYLIILSFICFIIGFTITDIYLFLKERNSPNNRLFRSFKKILNQFVLEDVDAEYNIHVLKDQFNNVRYRFTIDDNRNLIVYNHLGERICSGKV